MSKLIRRLEEVSSGGSEPIGFGVSRTQSRSPSLIVVATLSWNAPARAWPKAGADAFLLTGGSQGDLLSRAGAKVPADVPWGLEIEAGAFQEVASLKEKGCDFIVFSQELPATLLAEEELGRILRVSPSLSDSLLAAIDSLPIDAILVAQEESLKVEHLLSWQRLRDLVPKPILVASSTLSPPELKQLLELGIEGVVLPGEEKKLLELRQSLEGRPSRRKKERHLRPLLPRVRPSPTPTPSEEEEEEEEV